MIRLRSTLTGDREPPAGLRESCHVVRLDERHDGHSLGCRTHAYRCRCANREDGKQNRGQERRLGRQLPTASTVDDTGAACIDCTAGDTGYRNGPGCSDAGNVNGATYGAATDWGDVTR